jgi:hypothetical protein
MFVWKVWPQTLHCRLPTPVFFSMETETDFSWLQKRHWKVVGSFSFYEMVNSGQKKGAKCARIKILTLLGP